VILKKLFYYPIWLVALGTGAKSFRDNALIGSKTLNRAGLHTVRMKLAHKMAWFRRKRLERNVPQEYIEQFKLNGFIVIPDYLDFDAFRSLSSQIISTNAPAREMVQGDTITRRIGIGHYYLNIIPSISDIIYDQRWRGLMQYVASFATEPLYYVQTILKTEQGGEPDPQTELHADTFHPTMKAWFFLHDVAEDEGPFKYVPGSHLLTKERLAWEYERSIVAPEDLDYLSSRGSMRIKPDELSRLGLPQPKTFAVSANTLVIADTCGFHARAASIGSNKRIEIWAYSRRNPFYPWLGGDILSIRWIAERRIQLLWKLKDVMKRYLGQPWTDVGDKRPGD
jgi:hypothetical protein